MQKYEAISERIRSDFLEIKRADPGRFSRRMNLSWSNWGFGVESLENSADRLESNGIRWIELHGNLYGPGLGYRAGEVRDVLESRGIQVSGVCGMFSSDNDLSSNTPSQRQRALDYLERQLTFTAEVGGTYLLVVPGAVGRPVAYDAAERWRSIETLRRAGAAFEATGVIGAVEPIRADEVSLVHSVAEAHSYIDDLDVPGVRGINGDVFHMQASEAHIGQAILSAGDRLVNLHLADSTRGALGSGSLDIDTVIRSLYLLGFNRDGRFVTPEPLGPGASPYRAMWERTAPSVLDRLVRQTAEVWREREEAVLSEA